MIGRDGRSVKVVMPRHCACIYRPRSPKTYRGAGYERTFTAPAVVDKYPDPAAPWRARRVPRWCCPAKRSAFIRDPPGRLGSPARRTACVCRAPTAPQAGDVVVTSGNRPYRRGIRVRRIGERAVRVQPKPIVCCSAQAATLWAFRRDPVKGWRWPSGLPIDRYRIRATQGGPFAAIFSSMPVRATQLFLPGALQ